MSDLLPCPFCGGKAEVMTSAGISTVCCGGCQTMIGMYPSDQKAREAWNTRYKETTVYDKEEVIEGCTVQILTNTETGDVSVGWWRNNEE